MKDIIILFILKITLQKEINTFSNYEIIRQTKIEANFFVDFSEKIVNGKVKIYFEAEEDGEVIILDTKALIIDSIIGSDTGEELEYKIDKYYKLEKMGVPLKIYKHYNKGNYVAILINYSTTKDRIALDWLNPEQTFGKKYPFMYSQCQAILAIELLAIHDTPQ